jgi:hypothetical protein
MNAAQNHNSTGEPAPKVEEIDISLLEDSLRLTPWQRLVENQRMLALVRMLEAAQVPADGTAQPDS